MSQFDDTTEKKAEVSTKYFHKGSYLIPKELHHTSGFRDGRNSAKESLTRLARAVSRITEAKQVEPWMIEAAAAEIANVRAEGNWPLEEEK